MTSLFPKKTIYDHSQIYEEELDDEFESFQNLRDLFDERMHVGETSDEMFSWMICQLHDNGKPFNILYGQFSTSVYPPKHKWVFLANNSENNPSKLESHEFNNIVVTCKEFTDDTLRNINRDPTYVGVPTKYYKVSNCPMHHVNGRYMNNGIYHQPKTQFHTIDSEGTAAVKFKNVRNFYILRYMLQEIPELGILGASSYALNEGGSITDGMNLLAETANAEILAGKDPRIKDGSHAFKHRFLAISRAGNKLISVDQTIQTHHNNSIKAGLKNREYQAVLTQLATMRGEAEKTTAVVASIQNGGIGCNETMHSQQMMLVDEPFNNSFSSDMSPFADTHSQTVQSLSLTGLVGTPANNLVDDEDDDAQETMNALIDRTLPTELTPREEPRNAGDDLFRTSSFLDYKDKKAGGTGKVTKRHRTASDMSTSSLNSHVSQQSRASLSSMAPSEASVVDADFLTQFVLAKHVSYQASNTTLAASSTTKSSPYLTAEGEMSLEVTRFIEAREMLLTQMRTKAALLHKLYLDEDYAAGMSYLKSANSSPQGSPSGSRAGRKTMSRTGVVDGDLNGSTADTSRSVTTQHLLDLFELMRRTRAVTVDLAEAYATWVRIVYKQQAIKTKQENQVAARTASNTNKTNPNSPAKGKGIQYVVIVAAKSSLELYPISKAVQSTTKKHSRELEPAKVATVNTLVGCFDTREEAVEAYTAAYNLVPIEKVVHSRGAQLLGGGSAAEMCVNKRACGKHYIVRNNAVPNNLQCEQCHTASLYDTNTFNADKAIASSSSSASSARIYPVYTEPIAQFIYREDNYIAKMWGDLDFLGDVVQLRRLFTTPPGDGPEVAFFSSNPLLLANVDLAALLYDIQTKYYKKKKVDKDQRSDPFAELRGAYELNAIASSNGADYNAYLKEKAYQDGFKDSPYNHTMTGSQFADGAVNGRKLLTSNSTTLLAGTAASKSVKGKGGGSVLLLNDAAVGNNILRSSSATSIAPPNHSGASVGRLGLSNTLNASRLSTHYALTSEAADMHRLCFETLREDREQFSRMSRCLYIMAATTGVGSEALCNFDIASTERRESGRAVVPLAAATGGGGATATGFSSAMVTSLNNALAATSQPLLTHTADGLKLVPVTTSYDFRGTAVTQVQMRRPNAFRDDAIFCRTDVGEWSAGFEHTKGRAMKRLETAEALFASGKKKEEDRKNLQQLIRASIAVHITEVDTDYIQSLIEQARSMRGSVLALDIVQAESVITHYHAVCAATFKIQLAWHCCRSRRLMESIKLVIELKIQLIIATARESTALAHSVVPDWIAAGVKNRVKYLVKPLFQFTQNYSGQLVVISILRDVRPFRKPVAEELRCLSCQSKSTIVKRNGSIFDYDRTPYNEKLYDKEHLKHKNSHHKHIHNYHRHHVNKQINQQQSLLDAHSQHSQQAFHRTNHTVYTNIGRKSEVVDHEYNTHVLNENAWLERTPCTCQYIQQRESWVLRVYSPLSQNTTIQRLSIDKVKSILLGLHRAVSNLMNAQHVKRSLIGRDFDLLQPLFYPSIEHFTGNRQDTSYSFARRNAAAESSVLPLLPSSVPSVIMRCVEAVSTRNSETDAASIEFTTTLSSVMVSGIRKHFTTTPRPRSIRGYNSITIEDSSGKGWDWQPLAEMEQLQINIGQTLQHAEVMHTRLEVAHETLITSEADCSETITQFECTAMKHEDWRSTLTRTLEDIDLADRRIKEVMAFTKGLHRETDAQERNELANYAQSYDGQLEDGHQYRGMNQKRRLERLYEAQYAEYSTHRAVFLRSENTFTTQHFTVLTNRVFYQAAKKKFELSQPAIQYAQHIQTSVRDALREAINGILTTFSMPRKLTPKNDFEALESSPCGSSLAEQSLVETDADSFHTAEYEPTVSSLDVPSGLETTVSKYKKGNRRMQRIPYNFVFVRDHLERLRIEYRSMLTVLERRVMVLRPLEVNRAILGKHIKPLLRCVVVVYMDSLSGYFVVHVGQDERSVEESVQHISLGLDKKDFSGLTSHGLENDIVLRRSDVDELLSQPVVRCYSEKDKRVSNTLHRRLAHVADTNTLTASNSHEFAPILAQSGVRKTHVAKEVRTLLPSQQLRPLTSVKVHPVAGERYKDSSPSFKQRQETKERVDHDRAQKLLEYLRLQPHTGRPCLGLLHFNRLVAYCREKIARSLWFTDVQFNTPLLLINNHVHRAYVSAYNQAAFCSLYSIISQFEVQFAYPNPCKLDTSVTLTVPTDHIITSMQRTPLLLSAFLGELIINNYSHYTHAHILSNICFAVPSVLSNSWRNYMRSEVPNLSYNRDHSDNFTQSAIYRCHRFVDKIYCYVQYRRTVTGDLKITLSPPIDGQFSMHSYRSEPLDIHLSRDELRVLVARMAVFKNLFGGSSAHKDLVNKSMFRTLKLLHPSHLLVLLLMVTDCISFVTAAPPQVHFITHKTDSSSNQHSTSVSVSDSLASSAHRHHIAGKRRAGPQDNVLSVPVVTRAVHETLKVNFTLLEGKLETLYEQFNHWLGVRKHDHSVSMLSNSCVSNIYSSLTNYYHTRENGNNSDRYTVAIDAEKSTLQLVPVYHKVVKFLDLNCYHGDRDAKALNATVQRLLDLCTGATGEYLRELNPRLGQNISFGSSQTAGETSSEAFEVMCDVSIFTNIEKTKLYMDIFAVDCEEVINAHSHTGAADEEATSSSANVNHGLALILENERKEFAAEDRLGQAVRKMARQKAYSMQLFATIQALKLTLKDTLLPRLTAAKRYSEGVHRHMSLLREKLTSTYFYCLEYHAQTLTHQLAMSLQRNQTKLFNSQLVATNLNQSSVVTASSSMAVELSGLLHEASLGVDHASPALSPESLTGHSLFDVSSAEYTSHQKAALSEQFLDITMPPMTLSASGRLSPAQQEVNQQVRGLMDWCNECISVMQFCFDVNNADVTSEEATGDEYNSINNMFFYVTVVSHGDRDKLTNRASLFFTSGNIPRGERVRTAIDRGNNSNANFREPSQWQRRRFVQEVHTNNRLSSNNNSISKLKTKITYGHNTTTTTRHTRRSVIHTVERSNDADGDDGTAGVHKSRNKYTVMTIGASRCVVHQPVTTLYGHVTTRIYNLDSQVSYLLHGFSVVSPPVTWLTTYTGVRERADSSIGSPSNRRELMKKQQSSRNNLMRIRSTSNADDKQLQSFMPGGLSLSVQVNRIDSASEAPNRGRTRSMEVETRGRSNTFESFASNTSVVIQDTNDIERALRSLIHTVAERAVFHALAEGFLAATIEIVAIKLQTNTSEVEAAIDTALEQIEFCEARVEELNHYLYSLDNDLGGGLKGSDQFDGNEAHLHTDKASSLDVAPSERLPNHLSSYSPSYMAELVLPGGISLVPQNVSAMRPPKTLNTISSEDNTENNSDEEQDGVDEQVEDHHSLVSSVSTLKYQHDSAGGSNGINYTKAGAQYRNTINSMQSERRRQSTDSAVNISRFKRGRTTFPVFGFFIPQDQALAAVPIVSNTGEWSDSVLQSYLGGRSGPLVDAVKGSALEQEFDDESVGGGPSQSHVHGGGRHGRSAEVNSGIGRENSLCGVVYYNTDTHLRHKQLQESMRHQRKSVDDAMFVDDTFNVRMVSLVNQYNSNLGYRTHRNDKIKLRDLIRMLNNIRHVVTTTSASAASTPRDGQEDNPFHVYGDVVVMLRFGEVDVSRVHQLLTAMYVEYAPIKALRVQQRENREEFKLANYLKFRGAIFDVAAIYLQGVEAIVDNHSPDAENGVVFTGGDGRKHPKFNTQHIFPDSNVLAVETRLVLTKFHQLLNHCREKHIKEHRYNFEHEHSISQLQYASAIDTHQLLGNRANVETFGQFREPFPLQHECNLHGVEPQDQPLHLRSTFLKRFARTDLFSEGGFHSSDLVVDKLPGAGSVASMSFRAGPGQTLESVFGNSSAGDEVENCCSIYIRPAESTSTGQPELVMTTGQVVYAMYQLHCHDCKLPPSTCKFPGCTAIRGHARSLSEAIAAHFDSEGETIERLVALKGTGEHPLEVSIFRYFLGVITGRVTSCSTDIFMSVIGPNLTLSRLTNDSGLEPEAEILAEMDADNTVQEGQNYAQYLTVHHQQLAILANVMRLMHLLLVSKAHRHLFSSGIEVLEARGGVTQLEDEAAIGTLVEQLRQIQSGDGINQVLHSKVNSQETSLLGGSIAEEDGGGSSNTSVTSEGESTVDTEMDSEAHANRARRQRTSNDVLHLKRCAEQLEFLELDITIGDMTPSAAAASFTRNNHQTNVTHATPHRRGGVEQQSIAVPNQLALLAKKNLVVVKRTPHYVELPYAVLSSLLGSLGVDARGQSVPLEDLDPYPNTPPAHLASSMSLAGGSLSKYSDIVSEPKKYRQHAMSGKLFDWLVSHLKLTRSDKLPTLANAVLRDPQLSESLVGPSIVPGKPSSPANVPFTPTAANRLRTTSTPNEQLVFRFDRLHCEKIVTVTSGSDKTVVILQILHGVLDGVTRTMTVEAGIPAVGARYLPTEAFTVPEVDVAGRAVVNNKALERGQKRSPVLLPGLTILAYDVDSRMSYGIAVPAGSLVRVAETFRIANSSDYSALATAILKNAAECLVISRVAGYCTGITFDISMLESKNSAKDSLVGCRARDRFSDEEFLLVDTLGFYRERHLAEEHVKTAFLRGSLNKILTMNESTGAALRKGGQLDSFNSSILSVDDCNPSNNNSNNNSVVLFDMSHDLETTRNTHNNSQSLLKTASKKWSLLNNNTENSYFTSYDHPSSAGQSAASEASLVTLPTSMGPQAPSVVHSLTAPEVRRGVAELKDGDSHNSSAASIAEPFEVDMKSPFTAHQSASNSYLYESYANSSNTDSLNDSSAMLASTTAAASVLQHEGWSTVNHTFKSDVMRTAIAMRPRELAARGTVCNKTVIRRNSILERLNFMQEYMAIDDI